VSPAREPGVSAVQAAPDGAARGSYFYAVQSGRHAMQTVLIALLRFYKLAVSPLLGNRCRFYPSCSDYAREAIQYHGAARGTYLAAKRLCRCHPFSAGGIDLVPPAPPKKR
jgi:uncharacterized protein